MLIATLLVFTAS